MTTAAPNRLESRIRADQKALIELAAGLIDESVSEFVRSAAEKKAEQILREYEATSTVSAEFFDELLAVFDAPPAANRALARAAERGRQVVARG